MAAQSLKEKTAKGLFWGGLSNGIQQLLNLFFGIFLARLLSPDDYGMVGMLSIFSLIASALQESGFTAALANKQEVKHEDYNAVFWFSSGLSLCMYVILFFCAPLIAHFYENPELTALARYTFIGFFIASLGIAHNAYLFRNLMVKQKALATTIGLACSGVTGVIMAYLGFAHWGIATQSIVYIGVLNICYLYFSPWRPTLSINFKPLKEILSFSSKLLITNIFNHINNNIFSVILGKLYSEREVGHYGQANKWNYMGHSLITGMMNGVSQPVLSTTTNEKERQQRIFRKLLRFTAFVSFPVMLGISLIAPELIIITITAKWMPSAYILRILAIGGAFTPITALYSNLIISKGKSNIYMWNIICLGITLLSSILLLYPYGIHMMVSAYVTINICWLLIWHYFVQKEIDIKLFQALKDILPYAFIATAIMIITYFLTCSVTNIYILIITKILIAATLYIVSMWLSRSVTFTESIQYISKKAKHNTSFTKEKKHE